MTKTVFEYGMTVKQLKTLLLTWPDENDNGDPTEVWIGSPDGTSNQAKSVWPLDIREQSNGTKCADLLIEI
jgi:hypothetical protein